MSSVSEVNCSSTKHTLETVLLLLFDVLILVYVLRLCLCACVAPPSTEQQVPLSSGNDCIELIEMTGEQQVPLSSGNDCIELIEMTGEDGPIATTTPKYRMLSPDVCWNV